MNFADRKALFDRVAVMRESAVISYVTGDRRQMEAQISKEVVDLFVDHLDHIGPTMKISLLLCTNGGDTAAAWRLVNLLHTFCDKLEVIVTSRALSSGTLISLGADNIVMTKQAALGPIDPSVNHPLNPTVPNAPHVRTPVSVEAIRGYLDAADTLGVKDSDNLAKILVELSHKIHPLVLGQIFRTREQIRFLAKKLLKRQIADEEKTKQIIDFLCAESGSHDYTINRREARELGLAIENPSEELYQILKQIHNSYVAEMKLLEPWDPYAVVGDERACSYTVPRAAVESSGAGSHQFLSEGVISKALDANGHPDPNSMTDNRKFEGWRKVV